MLIPACVKSVLVFGCISISYWVCILHISFVMVCLKRWCPGLAVVGCTFYVKEKRKEKNQREKRAACTLSRLGGIVLLSTHLYCIILFLLCSLYCVGFFFFLFFLCQVGINRVRGGSAVVSNSRFSFVIRGSFVFGICGAVGTGDGV